MGKSAGSDLTTAQSLPSARKQKGACDGCRRRKVKCNRGHPCDKCRDNNLLCRYDSVSIRKGPKGSSANILSSLPTVMSPRSDTGADKEDIEQDFRNRCPTCSAQAVHSSLSDSTYSSTNTPLTQTADAMPGEFCFEEIVVERPRRVPPHVLLAHVNVFLKHLYPIMPVVEEEMLRFDCSNPETLPPQKYALLTSLCAATHIQLKLDSASFTGPSLASPTSYDPSLFTGEFFISECLKARQEFDVMAEPSCTALLSSFFLFASYGNMDKQNHAWFYLTQSISFAYALCLHDESHYSLVESSEAEIRRRIYWLLFVTERGYSLQRGKPVMLRPSIQKPRVFDSDNPKLAYGFLNLVLLFENIPSRFYDWISTGALQSASDKLMVEEISNNLNAFVPLFSEVFETQQVDILVTRNWLQIMLWRHSMRHSLHHVQEAQPCVPAYSPISIGKAILKIIASASQSSMDAHGIGMEQKLYDVGSSLVEVTSAMLRTADPAKSLTDDPRQLIWGLLIALSNSRGTQSDLFPALLQCSKEILGWASIPPLSIPTLNEEVGDETGAGENAWSLTSPNGVICPSNEVYGDGTMGFSD